jgi:hypothetical protein
MSMREATAWDSATKLVNSTWSMPFKKGRRITNWTGSSGSAGLTCLPQTHPCCNRWHAFQTARPRAGWFARPCENLARGGSHVILKTFVSCAAVAFCSSPSTCSPHGLLAISRNPSWGGILWQPPTSSTLQCRIVHYCAVSNRDQVKNRLVLIRVSGTS